LHTKGKAGNTEGGVEGHNVADNIGTQKARCPFGRC
jgi:hypothetical protein